MLFANGKSFLYDGSALPPSGARSVYGSYAEVSIRKHDPLATRFIVVDYAALDAIIARELGKRKFERIPVRDAKPDRTA